MKKDMGTPAMRDTSTSGELDCESQSGAHSLKESLTPV